MRVKFEGVEYSPIFSSATAEGKLTMVCVGTAPATMVLLELTSDGVSRKVFQAGKLALTSYTLGDTLPVEVVSD